MDQMLLSNFENTVADLNLLKEVPSSSSAVKSILARDIYTKINLKIISIDQSRTINWIFVSIHNYSCGEICNKTLKKLIKLKFHEKNIKNRWKSRFWYHARRFNIFLGIFLFGPVFWELFIPKWNTADFVV